MSLLPGRSEPFRRRAAGGSSWPHRSGLPRAVAALALAVVVLGAGTLEAYSAARPGTERAEVAAPRLSVPVRATALPGPRPLAMGALPEAAVGPSPASPGASASPPPSHYYAGAYYSGAKSTVDSVAVTIRVPDDDPVTSEYYALLSIWDTAGSYDQLGFGSSADGFGIAYSTSTYCAGAVESLEVAAPLSPGTAYTFAMTIGSGVVNFSARDAPTDARIWSATVTTGGDAFFAEGNYTCDGNGYLAYSDYEEVYETPGLFVPYDFWFTNNTADSDLVGNWSAFTGLTAPSGVQAVSDGTNVTVENEPYYLAYLSGAEGPGKTLDTEHNGSTLVVRTPVYVNAFGASPEVNLSTYTQPPAWSVAFEPSSGTPPFVSEITGTIPAGYGPGEFTIGINATTAPGENTRMILNVTLAAPLTVVVAMTPSSGAVDLGHSLGFSTTVFGGIEPFTYDWDDASAGCTAGNSSVLVCTAQELGSCNVTLEVFDALNYTASARTACTVDPGLTVDLGSAAASPLEDQRFVLDATALGGTGVYRFTWEGLPPGCRSTDTGALACTPTQPGPFSVIVAVRDTGGGNASAALGFTVVRTFLGAPLAAGYVTAVVLGAMEIFLVAFMLRRYRAAGPGAPSGSPLARFFGIPPGPGESLIGPGGDLLCLGCGLDLPPGGGPCPRCGPLRNGRRVR
jgi:hypothetical protein